MTIEADSTTHFSDYLWRNKPTLTAIVSLMLLGIVTLPNLGVLIAMFVVVTALLIGRKRGSFTSIGFAKHDKWHLTLFRGIALGVAMQLAFSLLFDPLIEKLTGRPIDLSNFDVMRGNLPLFLIWLAIGIGVGGFLEEITFRGYLITRLKVLIGDSPARLLLILLLTSVPFGLAHLYQDWSGVISTGCFAFLFGVIFIRSKYNLWMPILAHSSANVVGLGLIYTDYDTVLKGLLT